jgi:arylsulfatase A-like enzyme
MRFVVGEREELYFVTRSYWESGFSRSARRPCAVMLTLMLSLAAGCAPEPPHNVLLLIADDVGVPRIGAYAAHPEPSRTPTLDALAGEGVLFERAWATPMCSPSRAAILTGRLPSRNGIGSAIHPGRAGQMQGLDLAQDTLPRRLAARGVRSFAVGKWHLSGGAAPDTTHALRAGFAHYSGYPGNPPGADGYFAWTKHVNGSAERVSGGYLTSNTVDDAIEQIRVSPEPWFGWVGFHAVHAPLHAPPAALHSYSLRGAPRASPTAHYDAALEAMDHEIGRLLAGVAPEVMKRTTVVFVSDNGTSKNGVREPSRSAKRSLFEGGVRVPLIVAGAAVASENAGRASTALVHVTDIFATIAELFDADPRAADAQSLLPFLADPAAPSARSVLYTERFLPNGGPPDPERHFRAARDSRYKLIVLPGGREFYDLEADPGEERDLLAQGGGSLPAAALARLERAIDSRGAAEALR